MSEIKYITPFIRLNPYRMILGEFNWDPQDWPTPDPEGWSVETGWYDAHLDATLWNVEADFATLEDAQKAANGALILTRSNAGPGTDEADAPFDTWLVYEITQYENNCAAASWVEWGATCDEQSLEEALTDLSAQLGAEILTDLGALS